jgi:hypothetical protein
MSGEFLLGLSKEVRQGAGAEAGDEVGVTVEPDAKQEQTRQRRLGQALEMIRAGKARS